MGLNFPDAPTVGPPATTFTAPNGSVWVWDGVKWGPAATSSQGFLALSGGTMQGDLVLNRDPVLALGAATKQYTDTKLAKLGVTDGSDATAGQIGEYLSVTQANNVALTTATPKTVTTLALTAGDWDVWGYGGFLPVTGASTYLFVGLGSSNNAMDLAAVGFAGTLNVTSTAYFPFTLTRVSTATPVTVYLTLQAAFPNTANGGGSIRARRMR